MQPVILLVDDEVDLVEVLRDAIELSLPEHRALGATSAAEARRLVEGLAPGALRLVCADHRLGATSGLDLLESLRVRWPRVPMMLFTGQTSSVIEERARVIGARVVTKPLRLSQWLGEVQGLLDGAGGDDRRPA